MFWDMTPCSATAVFRRFGGKNYLYQTEIVFSFLSRSTVCPIHLNLGSFDNNGIRCSVKILKLLIYSGFIDLLLRRASYIRGNHVLCDWWSRLCVWRYCQWVTWDYDSAEKVLVCIHIVFVRRVAATSYRWLQAWWKCIVRSFTNFALHLGLSDWGKLR